MKRVLTMAALLATICIMPATARIASADDKMAGDKMAGEKMMGDKMGDSGMMMKMKGDKTVTLEGEVMSAECFATHGEHGAEHASCAMRSLEAGDPVSLLLKNGQVVLLVQHPGHDEAYKLVRTMAAKSVKATGTLRNVGGIKTLIVDSVVGADEKMMKHM